MGDVPCPGSSGFCPSEPLSNHKAGSSLGGEESEIAHFPRMLSETEQQLQEEGCG